LIRIKFKKLADNAIIPEKKGNLSNILVFRSPADIIVRKKEGEKIPLDLAIQMETVKGEEIKGGAELQISNPNDELPWGLYGILGTVDVQYRGNIAVMLINHLNTDIKIKRGDVVAYGRVNTIPLVDIKTTDTLSETLRGTNGFGHTGVGENA